MLMKRGIILCTYNQLKEFVYSGEIYLCHIRVDNKKSSNIRVNEEKCAPMRHRNIRLNSEKWLNQNNDEILERNYNVRITKVRLCVYVRTHT